MLSAIQIRLVHVLVFLLLSTCVIYACWSALSGRITAYTWLALVFVAVEGVVLAASGWRCPLTALAELRGASNGSVSHLFLPRWFADRLFLICGAASTAAAVGVVVRWWTAAV